MNVQTLTTDADILRAVEWCRDRAEFAECMGTCGRTLATCRQHGDLPIYLHETEGPYCKRCWEETHMAAKPTIDWKQLHDGTPLWKIADDIHENGASWKEVAAAMEEFGVKCDAGAVSAAVYYQRKQQAPPQAAQKPAPPVAEAAPEPTPVAPPAATEARETQATSGNVTITLGNVWIDVSGDDFDEVRRVAKRVLDAA